VVRKNSIRALLGVNVSKSRPVTMLQARPHAIHFKPIRDFGEGQALTKNWEPFFPRLLHSQLQPRLLATNFEKKLGIMGGLMMIVAYGSGIYSLSDRVYPCSAERSPRSPAAFPVTGRDPKPGAE
jgi:hypothetical protein